MNKNAQVNQIFVYIMSIIIVLFIGFLVTKFVFTFSSDAQNRASYAIYDTLKTDYKDIYQTYGSEKVLKYKISSDVNEICFISDTNSIDNLELDSSVKEDMKLITESGDNIIILSDGIKNSDNIGKFNIDSGSFCITPNNGYFTLVFENRRNSVYISEP